ncbi:MAG: hypothetical protein BGP11_02775 [Rhodobacterales bacterium 65-51]|uniref:hypothetical protein n=1 Tax=uncultured Gemmobacter sp. TaxID=1095917 RepID=UPI000969AD28|nr:hypothetical protein [uncultured Gemmobacter sp.]OJY32308.1 MAG: hypothetical protein BGP11_02775 [Rhodobacterales bacterium 65-51]
MLKKAIFAACAGFVLATPAFADEVTDALDAAKAAYEAGDLNGTAAQVIAAGKAVQALQSKRLQALLPEAPSSWTREVDAEAANGMAMMGMAGTLISARYSDADGNGFTLTLTADSPLVASMAGMLGNAQMMQMMGKVTKVGGQDMLEQGTDLSALVGNRVLVQAQGMEPAAMIPVLEQLDFAKLAMFDR